MDEIFDQMLATPSWADGVSSMGMESLGVLPGLPKMDSTHRVPSSSHLIGIMDNQLPSQSAMKINGGFDGSGLQQGPKTLSPMASSWREPLSESMPPMPTTMGSYSLSGDSMLNNLQLGKRTREEEEVMKAEMAQSDQLLFGQNGTGSGANGAMRPRVRARRGQATDPHSIAERKRRERIAERMKALQELVPDSNKTDKASMLDEIINYVKFLQMQVKCLSMCRLGGAGAAAPLLADMPGEGASSVIAANLAQASVAGGPSREGLAFAERQVAQLMDEDMSAAMQYLQSKGLCLMPISLATAISSTGGRQQKNSDSANGDQVVMEMQAAVANGVANPGVMAALAMNGLNPTLNDSVTRSGSKSKECFEDGSGSESDKT